jgi:hypothetical protein
MTGGIPSLNANLKNFHVIKETDQIFLLQVFQITTNWNKRNVAFLTKDKIRDEITVCCESKTNSLEMFGNV